MKQRLLLFFVMTAFITSSQAQKRNRATGPKTSGYAITAVEKGGRSWKEVRQVDAATGETVKIIYNSKQETEPLNARTGKPIVKKDPANEKNITRTYTTTVAPGATTKKVLNLDQELDKAHGHHVKTYTHTVMIMRNGGGTDKPFATNSAAMAYDKKHERLYYTPMGINQLRYIDLASGKIYYFEGETFGVVQGMGDTRNQVTRMVIASDGNGYALTNDANHLVRFTTDKKQTITDLGPVTETMANQQYSIHSSGGYGGDMVADASGNLYLITDHRHVFKINIESLASTYLGQIKGLPQGFSTNGAMVEEGSKVIVASSESVVGYYRVDLETLQAEKVSQSADVFNASDLANANLAFDRKKKKDKKAEEEKPGVASPAAEVVAKVAPAEDILNKPGIAVYPNPVTHGTVNLSFAEQPAGRYQVQLLDISGRLISAKEVNITSDSQVETFRFPELSVKGTYMLKVSSEVNKVNVTNKIVVQ